jgi:hypothetical protein
MNQAKKLHGWRRTECMSGDYNFACGYCQTLFAHVAPTNLEADKWGARHQAKCVPEALRRIEVEALKPKRRSTRAKTRAGLRS